jgi:hypothetical protein
MEEKIFMWYDSGDNIPCYGPHNYFDEQKIGKKLHHSLDDMLKMNISNSLKKRLTKAKIGTKIKIQYLHSSGDLMVMRIDETILKYLDELEKVNDEYYIIENKRRKLNGEREGLFDIISMFIDARTDD